MAYENIILEIDEPIALITLNRPPMNPLNLVILEELAEAIEVIARSDEVRVVIITGGGDKAFVAGADIKAMNSMTRQQIEKFINTGQAVMKALEDLPKPVIAAVNGFALGGGTELAISCDIILASVKAKFGQPEVKLGIIPGFGGTQRLPRLIGRNMAKELIYRGNIVNAEEALRIGLVNHIFPVEELLPKAKEMALEIAAMGPRAVACSKLAINQGYHKELDDGNRVEVDSFLVSFETEDRVEGIAAFVEKRSPAFKNR